MCVCACVLCAGVLCVCVCWCAVFVWVLCCAVLCCAVLCCVVLCCVVSLSLYWCVGVLVRWRVGALVCLCLRVPVSPWLEGFFRKAKGRTTIWCISPFFTATLSMTQLRRKLDWRCGPGWTNEDASAHSIMLRLCGRRTDPRCSESATY